jgi:hypothetical protein
MKMHLKVPYRVSNTVVEFEQDRRIAWKHFAPQRWRYELEPVDGGTRVTETFDLGRAPGPLRALYRRFMGFPRVYERSLPRSLDRLAELLDDAAGV